MVYLIWMTVFNRDCMNVLSISPESPRFKVKCKFDIPQDTIVPYDMFRKQVVPVS